MGLAGEFELARLGVALYLAPAGLMSGSNPPAEAVIRLARHLTTIAAEDCLQRKYGRIMGLRFFAEQSIPVFSRAKIFAVTAIQRAGLPIRAGPR